MESWVILGLGTMIALVGGVVGVKWVSGRHLDAVSVKKTLDLKDKYAKQLEIELVDVEKELKKWRGKFNQSKQIDKIQMDSIPTDSAGLESIVAENLPLIASNLPKEIGSLLMANKDKVTEFVKSNPEVIKRFITGQGGQDQSQTATIPGFDNKHAV